MSVSVIRRRPVPDERLFRIVPAAVALTLQKHRMRRGKYSLLASSSKSTMEWIRPGLLFFESRTTARTKQKSAKPTYGSGQARERRYLRCMFICF